MCIIDNATAWGATLALAQISRLKSTYVRTQFSTRLYLLWLCSFCLERKDKSLSEDGNLKTGNVRLRHPTKHLEPPSLNYSWYRKIRVLSWSCALWGWCGLNNGQSADLSCLWPHKHYYGGPRRASAHTDCPSRRLRLSVKLISLTFYCAHIMCMV